jgi:hypothetical protein
VVYLHPVRYAIAGSPGRPLQTDLARVNESDESPLVIELPLP